MREQEAKEGSGNEIYEGAYLAWMNERNRGGYLRSAKCRRSRAEEKEMKKQRRRKTKRRKRTAMAQRQADPQEPMREAARVGDRFRMTGSTTTVQMQGGRGCEEGEGITAEGKKTMREKDAEEQTSGRRYSDWLVVHCRGV
jgi:hypothetical protein